MHSTKDESSDDDLGPWGNAVAAIIAFAIVVAVMFAFWWAVFAWALPRLGNAYVDFIGWKAQNCIERGGSVTEGPLFGVYCVGPKQNRGERSGRIE